MWEKEGRKEIRNGTVGRRVPGREKRAVSSAHDPMPMCLVRLGGHLSARVHRVPETATKRLERTIRRETLPCVTRHSQSAPVPPRRSYWSTRSAYSRRCPVSRPPAAIGVVGPTREVHSGPRGPLAAERRLATSNARLQPKRPGTTHSERTGRATPTGLCWLHRLALKRRRSNLRRLARNDDDEMGSAIGRRKPQRRVIPV